MGNWSAFGYTGEYDENWPLPKHLTLAQYRKVIFRPDAHFVEGKIVPRRLGDRVHSECVGSLITQLAALCRELHLPCCISLRLQVSPTRVRVCDFVVLRADAPYEAVPTAPPLLCIEVLAPEQLAGEEMETLGDYLAMGVENIWLINPIRRAAFTFDSKGLHEVDPTNLRVSGTAIHVNLSEAFAALD